ncbi:MAG: hypothetical protein KatS3mg052_2717 [Candidatus Roseilinea sp.]|nr:MAG: hypothetical protein KatS3mg052_2717 [Candidatus Roseilinea sp.]
MQLTESQQRIMLAMARGLRLKDHRDIEGRKTYALHDPNDHSEPVNPADVAALVEQGLISSNKKFPSATYWLTEAGSAAVAAMQTEPSRESR